MILAIVAAAFVLRVIGLGWGLPAVFHQDEPIVVNHAMAIGASGWNPHFFVLPPFMIYFLFFLYGVAYFIGNITGAFPDAQAFGVQFLKDPSMFYWIGRVAAGTVFGTANVYLIYRVGRRFFTERAGLLAAIFLAIAPMHVQQSHYIYTDIALTFALTLLLHETVKMMGSPSWSRYLWGGALLGWAVSVKYTAALALPSLFLAHGLVWRRTLTAESFLKLLAAALASLAIYALIAPYTFLDWPSFQSQIATQAKAEFPVGWAHHFFYSLGEGTSPAFLVVAAAGLVAWFALGLAPAVIFTSFVLFYYSLNTSFSQPFARYMMPLVPLFCLSAACACEWLDKRFTARKLGTPLAWIIGVSLLVPTLQSDRLFLTKDTRTECAEWFAQNVPEGSGVVLDTRFYAPPLKQTPDQVKEKYELLGDASQDVARKRRLDLQLKAIEGEMTWQVFYLSESATPQASFLFQRPYVNAEASAVRDTGAEYLVFNYSEYSEKKHALKDALPLQLVKSFSPFLNPDKRKPGDPNESTAAPHRWKELFGRHRLGPYLEVYRIRHE